MHVLCEKSIASNQREFEEMRKAALENQAVLLLYSKITDSRVPSQIQGEEGTMVIWEIPDPQEITIYYRSGKTENLEIPEAENNMVYEVREFLRLIEEKDYSHKYLENSRLEMELMDEVRRQQRIVFPADEN